MNAPLTLAEEYGFTQAQLDLVRTQCVAPDAPDDVLRLHLHLCKNYGFDPMGNMLVWQKRWDKKNAVNRWTKVTTIDGFRSIAGDTAEMAGRVGPHFSGDGPEWQQRGEDGKPIYDENGVAKRIWVEAWSDRKNPPRFARVGILRANFQAPLFTVCDYDSYCQKFNGAPSNLWATMPEVMLGKCAEAASLRAAFPKKLAGLYVREEMDQAKNADPVAIVSAPQQVALPTQTPAGAPVGKTVAEALADRYAAATGVAAEVFTAECRAAGRKLADVRALVEAAEFAAREIDREDEASEPDDAPALPLSEPVAAPAAQPATKDARAESPAQKAARMRAKAMSLHGEAGHSDDDRRRYYGEKFGVFSFRDLSQSQVSALIASLEADAKAVRA